MDRDKNKLEAMNITEFKQIFREHAPCDSGADALERCVTRLQVYELAASPSSYDFLFRSVMEGWGPSPEDMRGAFRSYVNGGRSVRTKTEKRVILSQVWCDVDTVDAPRDVRVLLLFGCKGKVVVKPWTAVKIVTDANTAVTIEAGESSLVYVENYGGQVEDRDGTVRIKNIQ